MDSFVTLICNPAGPALDNQLITPVLAVLQERCAGVSSEQLAPGRVVDLRLKDVKAELGEIEKDIRSALKGAAIDVVVQPAANRKKRLLVADMDSTIIEQECIDELAEFAGKRAEISAITERAMRGELDFEGALIERVAMLKGLPETVLAETFEKHITLTPGARTLVQTMNKRGGKCALVSGGFTFFTERVAAATGFAFNEANRLIAENGVLTGDVARPIRGREAKEQTLMRIAGELGVALEETMAVGDGANDLSMLGRAGLGVAFHAKPAVAESAKVRIDHNDLTALLYMQGVPQADFVE